MSAKEYGGDAARGSGGDWLLRGLSEGLVGGLDVEVEKVSG